MMADNSEATTTVVEPKRGFRRRLIGTVKSNKMDKTVVVEVTRRYVHTKYKKYVKARERYRAHDENNEYFVGDQVEIKEFRPISRTKRWVVTKLVRGSAERQLES
jgi:small subunit ribosomal protein S17